MKKYCCHNCADSPFCAFCEDAEETILHMFWECPKVQDFWLEETVTGLQTQLNSLFSAASRLQFKVNMNKSNTVVFRKGGI